MLETEQLAEASEVIAVHKHISHKISEANRVHKHISFFFEIIHKHISQSKTKEYTDQREDGCFGSQH
jgi:hypothetical protein